MKENKSIDRRKRYENKEGRKGIYKKDKNKAGYVDVRKGIKEGRGEREGEEV